MPSARIEAERVSLRAYYRWRAGERSYKALEGSKSIETQHLDKAKPFVLEGSTLSARSTLCVLAL